MIYRKQLWRICWFTCKWRQKNIVVHATRASYLKWKPPIEAAWSWYIWYSEGSKKKHCPTAISRRRRKRDNFNSWFMKKGNNTSKCHVCFSSGRNLPRKARRLLCNESRYKICSSSPRNGACWSPDTGRINQNGTNKGFLILNFLFFSKSLRKCLLNDSDNNFTHSFF